MYAIRLRASAADLMTTASDWALQATHVLMYEHPEPGNIHCHFLLVGVQVNVETLKNSYKRHGLSLKGPGQVSFKQSFKSPSGTVIQMNDETIPKYVTYMTKGKYDPSYNKGYEPEWLESRKLAWQPYSNPSKDEVILGDFTNYLYDYAKDLHLEVDDLRLPEIRSMAIRFCISLSNGIINRDTRNKASMCYTSYCFRNGLLTADKIFLPFEPLK